MRERQGLIADRSGALHVIEATIAAFLMLSAIACLQSISGQQLPDNCDDVAQMATDLLYVLEHGQNRPGHPGLAQTLSSRSSWDNMSPALESDLRGRVPAGYRAFMETPYGSTGDSPPDLATKSVRPFLAYSQETGRMIGCSLVIWRP
jgi:hypothetical protein